MKMYPISIWAFYGICILILLLPVSRHWRLIAQGKKVQGTVTGYTARPRELGDGHVAMEYASEIVYTVGDTTYRTYGPTDLEYREDRKVPVLVDPGEPSRGITLTFSAIYLNLYSAVSVVLLILWAAFYLSFNSYSKRTRDRGARDSRDSRGEGTRDLASSPYRPFGKKKHGKKRKDGAREKGENGAGEQGADDPGEHEQGGGPDTGRKSLRTFLLVALLTSFHLIPALNNPAFSRTIHVEPGMDTEVINRFLSGARPGDTILFAPGTYRGPFILEGVHGKVDLPVVIRGSAGLASGGSAGSEAGVMTDRDPGSEAGINTRSAGSEAGATVIDGQTAPGTGLENQAFRLSDCSWIVIEGFVIRNCWTDLIRSEDVSYLSLRYCRMEGGKRALFARGRGSHHFLVEGCFWEQDERVWTHEEGFTWDEVHHGVHSHNNGSLFQGQGISGVFVLRDNLVKNTFNAFRVSMIGEAQADPLAGTNGEIYRNTVINTSDNVLEPELHALNLHFYHNRMINGHAFVSITEVAGGDIYVYGNTAVTIPGDEMGWTIFKISSRRTAMTRPLHIFNNSWWVNFDMVGSPRNIWENNHVRHFNNACYSVLSDSFGIYNLGMDNFFDYDCSNVPFPSLLTRNGHERNGIVKDPGFNDPLEGDFTLVEGSPCIDRGMQDPYLLPRFRGDAPDMGAYDDGLPVEGPPFRFVQPEVPVPFDEMPRITRYRLEDHALLVWFSAPLSEASVREAGFRLVDRGRKHERESDREHVRLSDLENLRVSDLEPKLSGDGYCISLTSRGDLPDGTLESIGTTFPTPGPGLTGLLPDDMPDRFLLQVWNKPKSITGMPMTGWASALPIEFRTDR